MTTMKPWLIVIAASAGGVTAVRRVLRTLPAGLPAVVVVLQHRGIGGESQLVEILQKVSGLPVQEAAQGQRMEPGHVYVARPDSHLTVTPDAAFIYRDGSHVRWLRSSANPLLESAARVFGGHLIAVVLTGSGTDATDGVQAVKAGGGMVIAQDKASSEVWGMPASAIATGAVDYVLPLDAIGPAIDDIVNGRPVASAT